MKRDSRSLFRSINLIIQNLFRRGSLGMRRFVRRGGVIGLLGRTAENIRRGKRKTMIACGGILAAVILIAILCIPGNRSPGGAVAASTEDTAAMESIENTESAQNALVNLEGDYAAALAASATPSPTPVPTPTPLMYVRDMDDPEIAKIQKRLMELGYMDNDEPTEHFGPITKEAVELFQRSHGLTIDGCVGQLTYDTLMSPDAKEYMVSIGVSGTDVEELQSRLHELDYLDKVTGHFGEETEAAVKEFQTRNNLSADGKVGENTREMLYSEDAIARSLSYGEESEEVLSYQNRLHKLGYLTTTPDGKFGKDTVIAVKMFQQMNGLIVDGHIGPQTKNILMSRDAKSNAITMGMSNSTVTKIQERLKDLGYLTGKITGYYGSVTEAAVMAFQKQNGLSRDGKVGKYTLSVLLSSKAKAAPSDYKAVDTSDSAEAADSSGNASSGGSSASSGSLSKFIAAAQSKLGSRYVRGGKGPNTFDCSGFVYWCLQQAGVNQSYLTSSMWRSVTKYEKVRSIGDLQKGDIIVYYGHVAIAMGDGTMIDASSSRGEVVHRSCTGSWSYDNFICAWRVF